jgi:ubiquinone/menaquinone biosynthesis C-methylase UbiE
MTLNPSEPGKGALPSPSRIMDLATGYWGPAAMLSAVELKLFDAFAEAARTAAEAAEILGCDARALEILMEALCALGLLDRNASTDHAETTATFSCTREAATYLVTSSPAYLGGAILWSVAQYSAWGSLASTVRSGNPAVNPALHLGSSAADTRTFVIGMNNRAKGVARGVVNFLDVQGCSHLLDVGGGPGAYSVLLVERNPGLKATVLDLPGILEVSQELISRTPVADQIMLRPGNATRDVYGWDEFDAVLFSGVLHQMKPETIQKMLLNAKQALQPGGRVIICDVMLEPDRTSPTFSTLFSLQMLLTSSEGAVFSHSDCEQWLKDAGFESVSTRALPAPLPYTVITARVPGN